MKVFIKILKPIKGQAAAVGSIISMEEKEADNWVLANRAEIVTLEPELPPASETPEEAQAIETAEAEPAPETAEAPKPKAKKK